MNHIIVYIPKHTNKKNVISDHKVSLDKQGERIRLTEMAKHSSISSSPSSSTSDLRHETAQGQQWKQDQIGGLTMKDA